MKKRGIKNEKIAVAINKYKELQFDPLDAQLVAFNEKIDESLIGGLVLRMGSTMIDSSIKTKLSTLKMIMKGV